MKSTLLVIPHYCDVLRVEPFLVDLLATMPECFSILVSDDGSPADEVERLREVVRRLSDKATSARLLPPLVNPVNRGKGAAVFAGWNRGLEIGAEWLVFADADGAVSASEILRARKAAEEFSNSRDVIVGSRKVVPERTVNRRLFRHVGGRMFAAVVHAFTGLPIHDTQCGLKLLHREAYAAVRDDLRTEGFSFDVELLLLLSRRGFRLHEFPVDWRDVRGGKVSLLRESLPMLREVIRLRRRIDRLDH